MSLVANRPCQNRTIFSSSGALVVTRRYIQVAPTLSMRRASAWSTWYRRIRSSGMDWVSAGSSSSSTVASYPFSRYSSSSARVAPKPARRSRWAIRPMSSFIGCHSWPGALYPGANILATSTARMKATPS